MSKLTEEMELWLEFDNPALLKKIRLKNHFLILNKGSRFVGEFDFNGENYFIAIRGVLSKNFDVRIAYRNERRVLSYTIKHDMAVRERILSRFEIEERDLELFRVPVMWARNR